LGYRRPFLISADMRRARERTEAFAAAWRRLTGKEPVLALAPDPSHYQPARNALAKMLDDGGRPDIVVCSSDALADACVIEARVRKMRIPDDLAVFGFGDMHASAEGVMSLSTVRIDGAIIELPESSSQR